MRIPWVNAIGAYYIPNVGAGYKCGGNLITRLKKLFLIVFKIKEIPEDTDILLIEGGFGFLVGFLFKKLRKKKVILIVSDPLFDFFDKRKNLSILFFWMVKDFDGFIPTSRLMSSKVPFSNKKIVNTFINVEKFYKIKPKFTKNLIYVGVLNKHKGIEELIEIFLEVKKIEKKSKLYLIGDGPLKEKILNFNNKSIILTGFVKNPERFMAKSTFFINFSNFDSFGNCVVEAMAAGLVPIISKNMGVKEVVEKVDPTLIINTKNKEESIKKILSLLNSEEKIIKELSNKCKRVSLYYIKERSVRNFKAAFTSFIK